MVDVEGSARSSPTVFDDSPTEGLPPALQQTVRAQVKGKDPVAGLTEVLLEVSTLYPTIPRLFPVDRGLPARADRGRAGMRARVEWGACVIFPDGLLVRRNLSVPGWTAIPLE